MALVAFGWLPMAVDNDLRKPAIVVEKGKQRREQKTAALILSASDPVADV